MARKTIEERGYTIPVKRQLAEGRYQKAYARSLAPNSRGRIPVAFDSGRTSNWSAESAIHEPRGFKVTHKDPRTENYLT